MSNPSRSSELDALAALPGAAVILEGGSPARRLDAGRRFAAARFHDGAVPCLLCRHCTLALDGIHADLTEFDAALTKGQIDSVRALRQNAFIRPHETQSRVFIIKNADILSEPSQNALLKVIEEPPPFAFFLFLTENAGSLLPTVRSRCVRYALDSQPEAPDPDALFRAKALLKALLSSSEIRELSICEAVIGWAKLSREDFEKTLAAVLTALRDHLKDGVPISESLIRLTETVHELLDAQEFNASVNSCTGKLLADLNRS